MLDRLSAYFLWSLVMTLAAMAYAASISGYVYLVLEDLIDSKPFALARRYGLAKAVFCLARRPRLLTTIERPARLAVGLLSIPFVNFMFAALAFALGYMLLLPHPRSGQILATATPDSAKLLVWGGLFAVCWTSRRYLAYMARPSKSRLATSITGPRWMTRADRSAMAVVTFSRDYATLLLVLLPAFPLFMMIQFDATRTLTTGQSLACAAAVLIPSATICLLAKRRLRRSTADLDAALMICRVLRKPEREATARASSVPDIQQDLRADLGVISHRLSMAADHLDAKQRPGFTPHPMATTMRAIAHRLTLHLTGRDALNPTVSKNIEDLLNDAMILVMSSRSEQEAGRIADSVEAFDAEGRPASSTWSRPPGRLSILAAQAGQRADSAAQRLTRLSPAIAIAVVLVLLVLGKMDLHSVLQYLK